MLQKEVDKNILSYIVGVALGDGNLSNPNGRATRLRVSCDTKYPKLIQTISSTIQELLPNNKVAFIKRKRNCCDISCYSNKWEKWLGWKALSGPKHIQKVSIPKWIMKDREFATKCLKGLIETDGSVYQDRGYKMVNFVTIIPNLAIGVEKIIKSLGFKPCVSKIKVLESFRYNIRISKDVDKFIALVGINKS